ncbi:hypothetical protein INT45_003527 [Circinella minor]|uniref:Uncharacterized protein n=1 Tax=Circinella minor TaxID=1195481 RepID=A0A8H7RSS7_9FUNG|nr:hypothetical protein INT45_003527 [Circinella minor]
MVKELEASLGSEVFSAENNHISCIGHVINLVVQTAIVAGLKAQAPENTDSSDDNDTTETESSASILKSLRSGIRAIRSSPTRRKQYIEFCTNATRKLKLIQLPLDVRTRWDSMYNMLWIAHKQRVAYNKMTMHVNGLSDYFLSDNDWEFIDQLQQFFAPFIAFQKKMSAQKYPTINKAAHPSIKEAAAHAFEKLKKYYSKATQPWSYVGWPEEWIRNAKQQVENEWAKYMPESEQQRLNTSIDVDNGDYKPRTIEEDALAAYLEERQRPAVDKLQFWKGREEAAGGLKDGKPQPLYAMVRFKAGYSGKFNNVFEEELKQEKIKNNNDKAADSETVERNLEEQLIEETLEEI